MIECFIGSLGGGQDVTVTGAGFGPTTSKVTICGETCTVDDTTSTSTQLVCSTPPSTGEEGLNLAI